MVPLLRTLDRYYRSRSSSGHWLLWTGATLPEGKTHRLVDRFETAGRGKECFRRTHKQVAGRRQEAAQHFHHPVPGVAVKVNQDVSAEDDVIWSTADPKIRGKEVCAMKSNSAAQPFHHRMAFGSLLEIAIPKSKASASK